MRCIKKKRKRSKGRKNRIYTKLPESGRSEGGPVYLKPNIRKLKTTSSPSFIYENATIKQKLHIIVLDESHSFLNCT